MTTWNVTHDLADFAAATSASLARDPVRFTQMLTLVDGMRRGGSDGAQRPWFALGRGADGQVVGAALCTPPWPVVLGPLPDDVHETLPRALHAAGVPVHGFTGALPHPPQLARHWTRLTGTPLRVREALRLFVHADPTPPAPAAGHAALAVPADLALVGRWWQAFADEVVVPPPTDVQGTVLPQIEAGLVTLWRTDADGPVSMAVRRATVAGSTRIGPVYTPAEHRGHGYAAAATWAAGLAARADGAALVTLYTDLSNPTSNALYQRLGYRPVLDAAVYGAAPEVSPPAAGATARLWSDDDWAVVAAPCGVDVVPVHGGAERAGDGAKTAMDVAAHAGAALVQAYFTTSAALVAPRRHGDGVRVTLTGVTHRGDVDTMASLRAGLALALGVPGTRGHRPRPHPDQVGRWDT